MPGYSGYDFQETYGKDRREPGGKRSDHAIRIT
jgi:hypothetical protein